jgi:hypothetical protein
MIAGCILSLADLKAQNQDLVYEYDASGNRVKRSIVPKTKSMSEKVSNDSISNDDFTDFTDRKDTLGVKIYPNPTSGILDVEIANLQVTQKARLYLYANTGRLVKQVDKLYRRQSIDISDQPAGIYLLLIMIDEKKAAYTIIKQ